MKVRRIVRIAVLMVMCLTISLAASPALAGGPPEGKGEKQWVSLYTADLPAQELSPATHGYEAVYRYTYPVAGEHAAQYGFIVDEDAPLYDGYALLRPGHIMVRVRGTDGAQCERQGSDEKWPMINPNQPLRFAMGWASDEAMTRREANAYFGSMTVVARLDGGEWMELEGHGVRPYGEKGFGPEQWDHYLCAFTVKE